MQQTSDKLVTVGIKRRLTSEASANFTVPANSWYVVNVPMANNTYVGYKTESGLISTYSDVYNGNSIETHYIGNAQILMPK